MITTTTHNIEGKQVTEYMGIVTGEAIIGANLFKDIFASITDVIGGRSGVMKSLCDKPKISPSRRCRKMPGKWSQCYPWRRP